MERRWVIVDDRLDAIYARAAQRLGERAPSQRECATEPRHERTAQVEAESEERRARAAGPLLRGLRARVGRFARLA